MQEMNAEDKERLVLAVKTWFANNATMKEKRAELKELRDSQGQLESVLMAIMEQSGLDVCRVKNGEKMGEITKATRKRTRAVKAEDAIAVLAQIIPETQDASQVWQAIQNSRETTEVSVISVRSKKM